MSDRENLIELLDDSMFDWDDLISEYQENGEVPPDTFVEHIADHLIANGVTVQKWIPVSERLPSDEKQVLAYIGYADSMIGFMELLTYFSHDPKPHWQYQDLFRDKQSVICWMHLPEPPKGE